MKTRLVQVGTLAVFSAVAIGPRSMLLAQGTQGAQEQVQLAFGYECEDRFLVRNDGAQPVTIEYGITGAEQRSSLLLKGKDAVELSSASNSPLELWVGGKIVATEQKGNRACGTNQASSVGYEQAPPVVIVRAIEPVDYGMYGPGYYAPPVVYVSAVPRYGYGYGYGYGYRSSVVVLPLFRGGFGGYGRDVRVNTPGRFERGGAGRPVPNHVEPRRSVQQTGNVGRGRQEQRPSQGQSQQSQWQGQRQGQSQHQGQGQHQGQHQGQPQGQGQHQGQRQGQRQSQGDGRNSHHR